MDWLNTSAAMTGMGSSAYSQYAAGKIAEAEAKGEAMLYEYQARVAELDALAREQRTKFDQLRQQRAGQKIMGKLRARLGASGAVTSEGAPLNLQMDQAFELALENSLIGVEGRTEAERMRSQGMLAGLNAQFARLRGKNALSATKMQAGNTLLSGFASASQAGMFAGGGGSGSSKLGSWPGEAGRSYASP